MVAILRVLLDRDLLISYLLNSDTGSSAVRVVDAAFAGAFALLLPESVLDDVRLRRSTKPYLRQRITTDDVERLAAELGEIAEFLSPAPLPYRQLVRVPKDDFLLAHAIAAGADLLVSGDKDLLMLGRVDGVRIASPAEFLGILDAGDRRS